MNNNKKYQAEQIPISDIIDCINGKSGLTEAVVYQNLTTNIEGVKYRVLSSALKEENELGYIPLCKIKNEEIPIFENQEGILVAINGNAGAFKFLEKGHYTLTNSACILYLKKDQPYDISLKWFYYEFQKIAYLYSSNSQNGTWNKNGFLNEVIIDIPTKEYQDSIVELFDSLENFHKKLNLISYKIEHEFKKYISLSSTSIGEKKIGSLIKAISRNDVLTEENLYFNMPKKEDVLSIEVLRGASQNIKMGLIANDTNVIDGKKRELKKIHITSPNNIYLHVIRKGKAGKLSFIGQGLYAPNSDSYLLYLNKDSLYYSDLNIKSIEDEEIYVRFLKYYLEPFFIKNSSNSDNGTFNKEFIFNLEIPIYPLCSEIYNLVSHLDLLEKMLEKVKILNDKIDSLYSKEIVCN